MAIRRSQYLGRATQNEMWNAHTNMTRQNPASWVALLKNLQRAIRNLDQYVKHLVHSEYKERRERFAAKLADNPEEVKNFEPYVKRQPGPSSFLRTMRVRSILTR